MPTRVRSVPEPDRALLKSPAVNATHPSVLKVTGLAESCARRVEGSGFVYAPTRACSAVLTLAR